MFDICYDYMVDRSIALLKEHEPPEGYYLAFSGGKDSTVIYDLAQKAGVKFHPVFSVTSVDPPEMLRFIKKHYPDVEWRRPKLNMFQLIKKNKIIPHRTLRYCCRLLKEYSPPGVTITGVRAEESYARAQRPEFEQGKSKKYMLLKPIFTWSEVLVWEYIERNNMPYCELYDVPGYDRIGCIMCPLISARKKLLDAKRYPKVYNHYFKTFKWLEENGYLFSNGKTAEGAMEWFMK